MRTLFVSIIVAVFSAAFANVTVVATNGMIYDIAAYVAGDDIAVTQLIPSGTDPHHYRATAADVRSLSTAHLILYSGYGLEARLEEIFHALGAQTHVVPVAERAYGVAQVDDPHVWLDVSIWAEAPLVIADALTDLLPDGTAFMERAATLHETLLALDAWVEESVHTIPRAARVAITPHDAFGHFGARYGIAFSGIQGPAAETEPAVADIRRVADDIIARSIPALFPEVGESDRLVVAVQEAVHARGGQVNVAGALYVETLGPAGSRTGTYVGIVIHNVQTIVSALGGKVVPLPPVLAEYE